MYTLQTKTCEKLLRDSFYAQCFNTKLNKLNSFCLKKLLSMCVGVRWSNVQWKNEFKGDILGYKVSTGLEANLSDYFNGDNDNWKHFPFVQKYGRLESRV